MKKSLSFAALLLATCGCSSMNNTQAGAIGGGIFGGVLGTIVGIATGHPLEGLAIGTGAGALAGGAIGHADDREDKRRAQAAAYALAHPALPQDQIIRLSQERHSDMVIINQINATNSFYQLTADDLSFLKQHGVSERVISHMQTRQPGMAPAGAPVIYVEQPPPVAVGFGFGRGPHRRHGW